MSTPSTLNINQSVVAYGDSIITNNPRLKNWDWTRNQNGIAVTSPKSEQFVIPARSTISLFSGLRATTIDATSAFSMSFLVGSTYRIKYTGGTDPTLATDIPFTFTNSIFTVVTGANQTITLTDTVNAATFSGVTAGVYLYIFSITDDALAGFNPLNAGLWTVLSKISNASIVLARVPGTAFSSFDQTTAALAASHNMIAYSLTTVQVGDKVRISAGFATASQATYTISNVTSKWVDITSTLPLAAETGILPGATGMIFYSAAKRYCRIETDQNARVYFNGSTNQTDEINPWVAGDPLNVGWHERIGPAWSLSVFNLSSVPMVCNLFSAE